MVGSTRRIKTENFRMYVQRSMRQLRREKKWTQEQLGRKLGVDQATISNYESGKTDMTFTQLFELFLIFGKDLSGIFDFKTSVIADKQQEEQEKE
ncbi:helix-turn-helix transcriptional regulator [Pseudoalteromonas luteoviolacea]|uniref:Putative transcriptional regulator n=1 Tax=Pseudoalteromonas luteoviolacea (strain 2ta16) TaxID=1353533 RepID=V4JC92_PSEL2|nr:helix-turn-helix transcriptional regulator [Pseudoalteromonas luteoviolacea]ESP92737.1 putative transcriptional regulator [Pseudoalteromonas luteoviolacea 2ta16]